MNDYRLEERKAACTCDVNALLAKERQCMRGLSADPNVRYVFCAMHGLWVPFEWVKAAA